MVNSVVQSVAFRSTRYVNLVEQGQLGGPIGSFLFTAKQRYYDNVSVLAHARRQ